MKRSTKQFIAMLTMGGLFLIALGLAGTDGNTIYDSNRNFLYALLLMVISFIVGCISGIFEW